MKIKSFIILICLLVSFNACQKVNIIELPITEHDGLGPFRPYLGGISTYPDDMNNPWKNTWLEPVGIPDELTSVKIGDIETNFHQHIYQSYLLGQISEEEYLSNQDRLNWIPDTSTLSKIPLRTRIAFARAKNADGETVMIVDANNNLDLSDDRIFIPVELDPNKNTNLDSLIKEHAFEIKYERLENNQVVESRSLLFVGYFKRYDMFMSCFPSYVTSTYKGTEFAVCSDNFLHLSYSNPSLVIIEEHDKHDEKTDPGRLISKGEYVEINGSLYRNSGVNLNNRTLRLEKSNLPKDKLYSTQPGFKAPLFNGNDFSTDTPVSIEKLKGKYVFLDFWAVWCGPCKQELPHLKELYERTERSKFEIIGVVSNSEEDGLRKLIDEYSISWPQLFSNNENRIKELYDIKAFPTTFLLDQNGVIIARDLRGKDLEEKLIELIEE